MRRRSIVAEDMGRQALAMARAAFHKPGEITPGAAAFAKRAGISKRKGRPKGSRNRPK